MKDKTLEQLTDEEFEPVIENFIEQEAEGTDEMEASIFFRLWDEIEKKRAKPTIEVEVNIVEGKLVLSLEKSALNVSVRENEIVTPYERIIVRKAFFDQTFLLKSLPWRKERMMSHAGISAREGRFVVLRCVFLVSF